MAGDAGDRAAGETPTARPLARPVPGRRLPGRRVADRLSRPPDRLLVLLDALVAAGAQEDPHLFDGGHDHVLLVTSRRDGTRVPTPVWTAAAGRVLFVRTQRVCGKVARIRRDPVVQVAPCTVRGRPLAAPTTASARILDPAEEAVAERALRAGHGPVRALCALGQDLARVDMCYLALTGAR